MRRWRFIKYLVAWILPVFAYFSLSGHGWVTFSPLIFAFVFIPLLDQCVGLNERNLSDVERAVAEHSRGYDIVLQLTVLIQVACTVYFLRVMADATLTHMEITGRILCMGLMNGVFGINVAHELGHRTDYYHRFLAKILLSTTLFLHFYVEHNKGHHRNVSTPEDPATARFNESIYAFFLRTIPNSYASAWHIIAKELQRKKIPFWSLRNEMILYTMVHVLTIAAIVAISGWLIALYFVLAALFGIVLLETVNYIEHYGLMRKKVSANRYEDVQAWHSWNSDFVIGRLVLFELTRHSDHHWQPNKPYVLLDSVPDSFQMPAGYPAMMLLTFFPRAWFAVMNKRVNDASLNKNPVRV
jgi:alkane 1-monooxygenase